MCLVVTVSRENHVVTEIDQLANRFKREWKRKEQRKAMETKDSKDDIIIKTRISLEPDLSTLPINDAYADRAGASSSRLEEPIPEAVQPEPQEVHDHRQRRRRDGRSSRMWQMTNTFIGSGDSDADDENEYQTRDAASSSRRASTYSHRERGSVASRPQGRSSRKRRRRHSETSDDSDDGRTAKTKRKRAPPEQARQSVVSASTWGWVGSKTDSCVIC